MSPEKYVALGAACFVALGLIGAIYFRLPKRLKREYFVSRWKRLQKLFPDESQWAKAIVEADDLLNEALKKKRFKGSGMGERLVEAQKNFTNNDAVWYGHKLRTKIDMNPDIKISREEVQKALFGLRQGLKDIGAFNE
jgi:hypothetical protein